MFLVIIDKFWNLCFVTFEWISIRNFLYRIEHNIIFYGLSSLHSTGEYFAWNSNCFRTAFSEDNTPMMIRLTWRTVGPFGGVLGL